MLKKIALFVIMALLPSFTIFAQEGKQVQLPDTPAGQQVQKFLHALDSGEYETYIKENFSEQFLKDYPMTEHLGFFRQMSMMHGGFRIHSIEKSTEDEFVFIGKSKKMDAWRRLLFEIESEPPYRVSGLGIEMAAPPEGMDRIEKKLTEKEILEFAESELQKMAESDDFSGAVLIAKNGKALFRKAYGMASKRFNIPNNIETRFNIGSINKSFTGMAIAQLLEKGKIHLDDKLDKYLPDFPKEIAAKVTIRHLLTMRSGMGSYWNDEWETKWAKIKTVEALIEIIRKIPLDFEPGTQMQYSNSGYAVLGAIIEKVSGQSYYDYVRENIFMPAGMPNTDSYELDQIVPNLAIGYTANRSENPYKNNKLQNNLFIHSVKGAPAGGGYSTLDDLLNYVEALKQNKLAGAKYTNMNLSMFRNLENPDKRPPAIAIAGGAPVGINAFVGALIEDGYTVVVLSNYDPPTAQMFGMKITKMLRNKSPI